MAIHRGLPWLDQGSWERKTSCVGALGQALGDGRICARKEDEGRHVRREAGSRKKQRCGGRRREGTFVGKEEDYFEQKFMRGDGKSPWRGRGESLTCSFLLIRGCVCVQGLSRV